MTLDLNQRIAALSPEKRILLEQLLLSQNQEKSVTSRIPRRCEGSAWPLSFGQERLWFLDQLEPGSSWYNAPWALRLRGELNVKALKEALAAVVRRHEALRTHFESIEDQLVQVVDPPREVDLGYADLGGRSESERQLELPRLLEQEANRTFDLSRDLMLRALLVREKEAQWVLMLVTHHIASDGWSHGILCRELGQFYGELLQGQSAQLEELPIQYADYAVWQRRWLTGEVLENQLAYWKHQLGGELPALELPADRPRAAVLSYRGGRIRVELPDELSRKLKALSRQQGVTLFMALLAAFKVLLYRYTGQTDLAVGTPIAGRTHGELEGLIGFFLNTLVLRTNLNGDPSFRELLARVREVALGAYAHQELPFEKLVEELQPERDLGRNPLFQVMFILQNAPARDFELKGLVVERVDVETRTAKFDLTLSLTDRGKGLVGSLEYNADLLDRISAERLTGHYQRLLEGAVENPDERISRLPLLTETERQQILVEWNDTWAEYPRQQCIHELFELQVARSPEAVALVHQEDRLNYGELNGRANQLAYYLRRRGVGPETLVGICMERSVDMVVGLLGILKAGGAYVPLDPAYPQHRLAWMVEDARIRVVLTQQRVLEAIPIGHAEAICLDKEWDKITLESRDSPASVVESGNLAYVIYTSGSTGQPKGVQIPHSAVVNFLHDMHRKLNVSDADTVLAVTTLSFDIAGLELFLPLSSGARVVVASREETTDGRQLMQKLTESEATLMQATPATWRMLVDSGWTGDRRLRILCGGEALPPDLAGQLLEKGNSLWNLYGPTETTIWSSVFQVTHPDEPILIGRPIANTQFYVMDSHFQAVPAGVPGELCIGGDGLSRGYLNQPELTREKFIPNPLSGNSVSRLYRTGDLVRYRPDGNLEFLGRMDNQVKLRGFRIELGEIEAALRLYPSVREAVVHAWEMSPLDKRLAAYIVTGGQEPPSVRELRDFLRERLPDYMIPSSYSILDALPLTPNGKVDRKALPLPEKQEDRPDESYIAPRNSLEFRLVEIWERVLNVRPIGMRNDFFELGGHSLLAVRLFSEIRKVFNKDLRLATLFQAPTIEQLADVISQEKWTTPWSSLVAIQPRGSHPPFFCVHAHGGEVLGFRQLAAYLGTEQPFYGLQASETEDNGGPQRGIADRASRYLQEIRSLQPEGPYFIGGHCYGAKIAFEMAHLLLDQKQEVALLAFIDAYAFGYPRLRPWLERRVKQRISYHFKNLQKTSTKEKLLYFKEKAGILKTRAQQQIQQMLGGIKRLLGKTEPGRAALGIPRYEARVYPGKIILFSPSVHPKAFHPDPDMGWERLSGGGLEIHQVCGEFGLIIREPAVRILSDELKKCLSKAQGRLA